MQKIILDATDKKPGRIATEIAVLLMGKNRVDYARNKIPEIEVEVQNTSKLSVDMKKQVQKLFSSHSGYPGHLKRLSVGQVLEKKGSKDVLRRAVMGMLPKNKLRARMIKNLKLKD